MSAGKETAMSNPSSAPTLEQLIERIKEDVISLMAAGSIPKSVKTFSELHNYCDANCLGGLCEDTVFDALMAQHGGHDDQQGMPQGMLDMINAAQSTVGKWLAERVV